MNLIPAVPDWLAWCFAALLLAAAVQDAIQLRISNIIVGLVLLSGIVALVLVGPEMRMWQNFAVFAFLLAAGIPLFAAGKLGGGDVKLLAATGLWFDIGGGLRLLVTVLLAGGLLAVVIITLRFFGWSESARRRVIILRPKSGIPYAVAIASGAVLTILVQRG